jgi:hypothetical protein
VELIGPGAKLFRRETVRLENGLGNGDFKLTATIPAGRYRLRAYTNWMRNFGDNFIFEKNITVVQTAKIAVAATKKNKRATAVATATVNAPAVTVNFYPEGGSLVEGISSIVGIKAENGYGKGIAVKGIVLSSAGDTVSRFTCDSLGMGLLVLLPIKGLSYRAIVNIYDGMLTGREYNGLQFELPPALNKGLTLQVRQADSVIHLIVNSFGLSTADKVSLAVKHGGKTQLSRSLQLQNQQAVVKIPNASLPEGISAITIYNTQDKPECERLVYIHHPDSKNILSIATDKKSYQPKSQVTVNIKTLPNANLSLAAVDATAVPVQKEDILTYLNLQSEVKGNIEHPDRYFDTTNVNRFKQLDQLLLTQGWRNFIWRRLEDTTLKTSYEPEQGIAITGRVRKVGVNKGLPGISVTMQAPKAVGQKLFWATTDSAGRFAIYNTRFYGYQYISFTSRRGDKINKKGESKGSSSGYIQVDSLLRDTLAISPEASVPQMDTTLMANRLANEAIERIKKNLKLPDDHNLREVTIRANPYGLIVQMPPEIHPMTLIEQKDYSNLAQYLLYMIDGSTLSWDGIDRHILTYKYFVDPVIEFNGRFFTVPGGLTRSYTPLRAAYENGARPEKYLDNELLTLPMSNILKVIFNKDNHNNVMSVNLVIRSGVLKPKDYFDNTMADMVGYYKAREFYKPTQQEMNNNFDTRTNTIHWEPNITTNEKGEATVSFTNTEQTGKKRLIVEGITDTGTPLVSTIGYEVK